MGRNGVYFIVKPRWYGPHRLYGARKIVEAIQRPRGRPRVKITRLKTPTFIVKSILLKTFGRYNEVLKPSKLIFFNAKEHPALSFFSQIILIRFRIGMLATDRKPLSIPEYYSSSLLWNTLKVQIFAANLKDAWLRNGTKTQDLLKTEED